MSKTPSQIKLILANLIGTTFELYELSVYGFLAPIIAANFFPNMDKSTALINTFGIFFAGFIIRPLGAVFFGHIGDTKGRKKALVITMLTMSAATFCIGLLPTYHHIGLWAPILLALCRGIQGFSFSAEYIGSLIFLMEHSPIQKRGFMASWATCGGNLGLLLASLVCWIISHFLNPTDLNAWGWRIPFLLAVAGGSVGIYLRLYIQEFISFTPIKNQLPIVKVISDYKQQVLLVFCLSGFYMIVSYLLFVFSVTYLTTFRHLPMSSALAINTIGIGFYVSLIPFISNISDKIGRKPLLLLGTFVSALYIYPYYHLLQSDNLNVILLAHLGIVALTAIYTSTLPVVLAELVPANIRFTNTGFGYNLAGLCVGGTTPLLATLIMQTHLNYKLLCGYFVLWAVIASFAALKIRHLPSLTLSSIKSMEEL